MKTKKSTTARDFLQRLSELQKKATVLSLKIEYIDETGLLRPENSQTFTIKELYDSIKDINGNAIISNFELVYCDKYYNVNKIEF